MPKKKQGNKPKKIPFRLIDRPASPAPSDPHGILDALVAAHHPHLAGARVALAWNQSWKEDKDGHLTLGKCKKVADLDRHLHDYDFVILLHEESWVGVLDDHQRRALMDHELHHAGVVLDENGDPKLDDTGRVCYRIRKHDIEEFSPVVKRYGCYKRDLEEFVAAAMESKKKPLFKIASGE